MKGLFFTFALCLVFGLVVCHSRRNGENKQNDQSQGGNEGIPFWAARGKRNDLLNLLRASSVAEGPEDLSVDLGQISSGAASPATTKERSQQQQPAGWIGDWPSLGLEQADLPISWLSYGIDHSPPLSPLTLTSSKGLRTLFSNNNKLLPAWVKVLAKRNSDTATQTEVPFWAARG